MRCSRRGDSRTRGGRSCTTSPALGLPSEQSRRAVIARFGRPAALRQLSGCIGRQARGFVDFPYEGLKPRWPDPWRKRTLRARRGFSRKLRELQQRMIHDRPARAPFSASPSRRLLVGRQDRPPRPGGLLIRKTSGRARSRLSNRRSWRPHAAARPMRGLTRTRSQPRWKGVVTEFSPAHHKHRRAYWGHQGQRPRLFTTRRATTGGAPSP
jgi:hypothetical protein